MKILLILGVFVGLRLLFWWLGSDDNGGWFGGQVRASNWTAWNDAVQDKKRELAELESVEPKN